MAKYDALRDELAARRMRGEKRITMTFAQINRIVPGGLPRSAFEYQAWWSNSGHAHVEWHAWRDAGFRRTDLSLQAQTVTFERL